MKSFFTKLGKLLLCGVAVAVVGCTDYDTDIQNVNNRLDELEQTTAADLEKAISDLQASIDAKFATKDALASLETQLEGEIDDQIKNLKSTLETAINKKADKAEVEAAIKTASDAIEALQTELANAKAALTAEINKKADQTALDGAIARIATLENGLAALTNSLADLKTKVTELDSAVKENTSDIAAIEKDIEGIEAEILELEKDCAANLEAAKKYADTLKAGLDEDIQEVKDLVTKLEEDLTDDIEALQIKDGELETAINDLKDDVKALQDEDVAINVKLNKALGDILTISQNLDKIKEQTSINAGAINEINNKIKPILETYADLQKQVNCAVKTLNAHIEAFKTYQATINDQIKKIQEDSEKHRVAIENLEKKATDAAEQIAVLKEEYMIITETLANLKTTIETNYNELSEEIDLVENDLNELQKEVTALNAMLSQVHASLLVDIEKLMNQVQSLVYVPEYDDHKATLDFAKVGKNIYIPAVSTLRYVVKSNGVTAADLAMAYTADNTILSYLTKEVAVRTKAEAAAELEIVKVYADKEGYLCVDVLAKNFDPAFYTNEASYSVALALVQAEETNNLTSEYTNLVPAAAPKHKADFCVQTLFEGKTTPQAVVSNASGNMCIIQRNGFIATNDTETVYKTTSGVPGLVIDNKFYNEEELLEEFGYAIDVHRSYRTATHKKNGEYYLSVTLPDVDYHDDLYMLDRKNFISDPSEGNADNKVISLTEVPSTEQTGRVGMYTVVEYSYGLGDIYITNKYTVTIANKVVSYDVPAVVVPWTMGLADSLSVVTENATRELYAADLVRNAPYTTPEDFEGFTLHSIVQTGETLKREVTLNGAATTDVDIQASIKDSHVVLTLINASEKGYAFPEHDAENEYNEYKITWIKEHESVTATVTATLLLGKKPAPVAVPMEDVTLQLVGKKANYYTATVDFVQAAYDKFDELGLLGYADTKAGEAAFKAAFEVADPSDANNNTVTVNGSKGSHNNVSYASSLIRFYNNNVYAADGQDYVSQVNNLWFEVPFTFTVKGILDEPSYGLVFSQNDFVTPEDETHGIVDVDGDIVGGIFTIDQADLAKYFEVSNDVDNDNDLTVKFIVNHDPEFGFENAPDPETDVVAVNPVEGYDNFVLDVNEAVIRDWTNGDKEYHLNKIVVEAVLMANGTFELDRKTVELRTPDPLQITSDTLKVTRYPGKDAVVKTFAGLTITSTEVEGDHNLVNVDGKTSKGIFFNSHADEIYGAKFLTLDAANDELLENPDNAPVLKSVRVLDANDPKIVLDSSYNPKKFELVNGVLTVFAEDAILKNIIEFTVEYRFTHNFNNGEIEPVEVVAWFVPASADEYAL